jgi:hypothetical protein
MREDKFILYCNKLLIYYEMEIHYSSGGSVSTIKYFYKGEPFRPFGLPAYTMYYPYGNVDILVFFEEVGRNYRYGGLPHTLFYSVLGDLQKEEYWEGNVLKIISYDKDKNIISQTDAQF